MSSTPRKQNSTSGLKESPNPKQNRNSVNTSMSEVEEKILKKRMKYGRNTGPPKRTAETDINIEKHQFDNHKKDLELKKFQMDKTIKDVEWTVLEKEKRRNVLMQNEFEKERNYLIDQQKLVKAQIEEVSRNNINEKFIKMLKEEVHIKTNIRLIPNKNSSTNILSSTTTW